MLATQLLLFGESNIFCARCDIPCRASGPGTLAAQLLRRATSNEDGLCVNCAVTAFLKSVETIAYGIKKNGVGMLLRPDVQKMFTEVMVSGNADANPEEIDWERVVNLWNSPFLKGSKKRMVGI